MITKIVAPTNNVNDTSVTVYELLVADESEVKQGQAVLIVETSKATVKIESPVDGFIKFIAEVGDEIPNGEILAVVVNTREELKSIQSSQTSAAKESVAEPLNKVTQKTIGADGKKIEIGVFDCPVTLGEIMFKNGSAVKTGDILCKVRRADKVEVIKAPFDGFVFWNKKLYETVKTGESVGVVSESPVFYIAKSDISSMKEPQYQSLRLSKAAKRLLDERGLTAESLGLSGLVTVDSILGKIEPRKILEKSVNTQQIPQPSYAPLLMETFKSTAGHYEKFSKAKQAEGDLLARANKNAVVSQVSVLVPTNGVFSACAENAELARKFSSIIILEVSRLLKSYPVMNAVYSSNSSGGSQLYVYDSINVGYALSIDDGLKVPVFKNADKKDLESIMTEKDRFIEKYINRELSPTDMDSGTFTITDLSSSGCYFFNPVLNLGQSAILGIGGEDTSHTNYPLILAFDHRVIDGSTGTEFLTRLRDRLIAHERVLCPQPALMPIPAENNTQLAVSATIAEVTEPVIDIENLACDSCFRTAEELDQDGHYLFKIIDKYGQEKHICSICMRGW